MASISDYGELKAWIATTGHRGDLTSHIPGFIQSAETMIADKVRAVELVTTATLGESDRSDTAVYNLPSDFIGARAVTGTRSSAGYELKQVSIAELYRYGLSGNSVVFAIYGSNIEFRASPAVDQSFTLVYYKRPAAFSADGDTNLLLTTHPVLYQHAAMHWFHIHTMDVELAGAHLASFDSYVIDVNAIAEEVRGTGVVNPQYNYNSRSNM
ncbi:MAG: hypothetical protein V3S12_00035 [Acidiferrobacterales bacterium]